MQDFERGFPESEIIGRYHMSRNGSTRLWFAEPGQMPDMFFHRTYTFGAQHYFAVHYIFFVDENCTIPSISAIWEGRYWLLEPHREFAHARLGDFRLDQIKMAVLERSLLQDIAKAGSEEWALGLFRDITNTGFPSLGPLFAPLSPELTDYDIVYLHDGVLKTGLRTGAMMKSAAGRPTAFQDALPSFRE